MRWRWNTTWFWVKQVWERRVNSSGGGLAVLMVKRGSTPVYIKGVLDWAYFWARGVCGLGSLVGLDLVWIGVGL